MAVKQLTRGIHWLFRDKEHHPQQSPPPPLPPLHIHQLKNNPSSTTSQSRIHAGPKPHNKQSIEIFSTFFGGTHSSSLMGWKCKKKKICSWIQWNREQRLHWPRLSPALVRGCGLNFLAVLPTCEMLFSLQTSRTAFTSPRKLGRALADLECGRFGLINPGIPGRVWTYFTPHAIPLIQVCKWRQSPQGIGKNERKVKKK